MEESGMDTYVSETSVTDNSVSGEYVNEADLTEGSAPYNRPLGKGGVSGRQKTLLPTP